MAEQFQSKKTSSPCLLEARKVRDEVHGKSQRLKVKSYRKVVEVI